MPKKQTSLAVLPFSTRGPQEDISYLGEGIGEEIIQALSRIPELKVSSRRSSFKLAHSEMELADIAQALEVENILEGSIEVYEGRLKIRAHLIHVESDDNFWSQSWQRDLKDIFAVQDEISLEIADQLREHFGHLEIDEHLYYNNTDQPEAYKLFLKARQLFNRWNPQDVHLAIEHYRKALVIDPNYRDAHLGLADAYGFLATAGFADPEESWRKAKTALDEVALTAPDDPGLNYQLANYTFFVEASYSKAYQYGQKSIRTNPGYAEGQQFLAFLEIIRGNLEASDQHLHYALAVDPLNPESRFYQAYSFYRKEEFELAIARCEELLDQNPHNLPARIVRYYALLCSGKHEQVKKELELLEEASIMPDEALSLKILTLIEGDIQEAKPLIAELEARAESDHSPQAHAYLYLIYAQLNAYDQAFDLLEKLFSHRSSILLLNFMDPLAKAIHKDPRFDEFHSRIYAVQADLTPKSGKKELLSAAELEQYRRALESIMEKELLHLDPNLKLRDLAAQLTLHPNQLSWLINESLGLNFNDFINQYRIEHWERLAKDPANQHISILGLAYESGFNSKSVFNTSYKKFRKQTPSSFMAQYGS